MFIFIFKTYSRQECTPNTVYLDEHTIYGSKRLGVRNYPGVGQSNRVSLDNVEVPNDQILYKREIFAKHYEVSDHLGNVRAVIGDTKWDAGGGIFRPNVITYSNYYPFGMAQPGRNLNSADYKFGYNGKEKDDEIKGSGNSYDYGFRMYDPRVAKFLSIDPLKDHYPWFSPFQFAGNTPIQAIDLDGLEQLIVNKLSEPTSEEPGKAEIIILMDYMMVTQGVGAISKPEVFDPKMFSQLYSKGNTEFSVYQLPSMTSEMVTRGFFDKIWDIFFPSPYYNLDVKYSYNLIINDNTTYAMAKEWMLQDPISRGMVMQPPNAGIETFGVVDGVPNTQLTLSESEELWNVIWDNANLRFTVRDDGSLPAAFSFNESVSTLSTFNTLNIIVFHPEYSTNPSIFKLTTSPTENVAHEAGHNAAAGHYHKGTSKLYEYYQIGLQSNQHGFVFPTTRNTKSIINDSFNRTYLKHEP